VAGITTEVAYQLLLENRASGWVGHPAWYLGGLMRRRRPPSKTMNFVVGDTLVVINQDSVDHQLGTLWIREICL
jgi:hypothetical protein